VLSASSSGVELCNARPNLRCDLAHIAVVWLVHSMVGAMKRVQLSCALFVLALAQHAQPAHATELMMVVNEVDPNAQWLELQDIGDETFDAPAYFVDVFDGDAAKLGRVAAPGISGGNFPRYYVLAADGSGVASQGPLTVALPAIGQACFIGTAERLVHCVAWGCVTTKITPATPLGASPPAGMSLQRTPSGAALTVSAPTPAAANADGEMSDPCAPVPMGDGDPGVVEDSGCCSTGRRGSGESALALGALVLTLLRRRRCV
jgi:hypothetical protein